ncbi:MAG: CoA-binding protein [Gammaproteobacteria bacterium]|nr:CoA-binding protein [Gammaproteobacteria bacterium]MBU6510491.1 CoA-binding protein [Gammaproteobacteria bacterium]MDE1984351.1 CoA-binding protein [Gammaproteobacteria bacterium]MDE2461564.1 CoA-binding protein [Gammaproteobacteria bacterium]
MAFRNPPPEQIRALLQRVRRIAVVGLSPNPARPSYGVARSLQQFGYQIVPVRPAVDEVLGEKAYPDLRSVPGPVDLVDVFRAPEHVDGIVDDCIALHVPALWLQEGVVNAPAAERARQAGIMVVMDRCIYKDYRALLSGARA